MDIKLYQVDAFTRHLFAGNPAGVVTNAELLDEKTMQKIARELNNSETAFIINHTSPAYDMEVRFFTPVKEVPICGHATVSAHYVYAHERGLREALWKQKTKAGILPVEIVPEENDRKVVMTQAGIVFGDVIEKEERHLLLEGLGITEAMVDQSLPIQIVSTGHSKVMVPLQSKSILDAITIDSALLTRLSRRINCNGFFPFTFDSREQGILTSGRMFAPAIGIAEDPVTGNANGPLGAYLSHYGRLEAKEEQTFTITQGDAMGRKGYMDVHVFCKDKKPHLIKISGHAKIVFETTLSL